MPAPKLDESRDRDRPLKVLVSERERAEIETRAAATGLSVSAYLRNLGLGFQPHSTLDQEAILNFPFSRGGFHANRSAASLHGSHLSCA